MKRSFAVTTIVVLALACAFSGTTGSTRVQGSASPKLTFAPPITFAAPVPGPNSLAAGDFNNDGILDLVVVGSSNCILGLALGNGDGTFGPWTSTPAAAAPHGIALGDFNLDGNLDAAVGDARNLVGVSLGDGRGGFPQGKEFRAGVADLGGIAVADVNGDGIPDIVGTNVGISVVFVLLGRPTGGFQRAKLFKSEGGDPQRIAVGDFNGDGIPDLAVTNYGPPPVVGSIGILLGNGDGTFRAGQPLRAGIQAASIALGDFNGDGKLDIAEASQPGSTLRVYLGNGDGTFASPKTFPIVGPNSLVAADINGDGKLDIVAADEGIPGHVSVLLGNGDGTFQPPVGFTVGRNPIQAIVADFNGDGKPDLAAVNNPDGTVSVLLNTTPFPAASAGAPDARPH